MHTSIPQLIFPENWTCEVPPEIWRLIAMAYRTDYQERSELEDNLASFGICHALLELHYDCYQFLELIKVNKHRLPRASEFNISSIWPVCDDCEHERIFDLMRAEICEQIAGYLSSKP